MSGMNVKIDKFMRRNSFSLLQIKMRALLKQQGLWVSLARKPANPITAGMVVLEEKAHSTIMLSLADDIITEIVGEETVQGLWVKLEGLYMTKSLTNKLFLKQRLFSLRMQEGMPLRDHLDQLNTILLELRNIDVKVKDEDAALILLVSLPLSYKNFVQSFIVGKDTMSPGEVRSSLHTRELCHKATGTGADNQAARLVTSGSYGHGNSGKKKFKKLVSKGLKPDDVCNYYKENGHWKSDCPKKNRQQDKLTGTTAIADINSKENIVLVVDEHMHHNDVWILDSEASYHIFSRMEWFTTYEQVDEGNIFMANNSVCKAVGISSIKIRTHDGKFCTLNDVRHVPLMTKNLISLSMLDNKGFSFQGEGYGDGVKVYRIWSSSENRVILSRNVIFDENSMFNPTVKSIVVLENGSVEKQVEQQATLDESEPQHEDQHLQSKSEPSGSSLPVASQHSLALDRSKRANYGIPPKRYGFEDIVAYAL
ncbi:Retrovirus-related Pol polyprotein from transposon TNT 1-94 [Melia azedarach]|uniref:Retrovirus-related Pol polyprotein from transposon TNT 1-94 n=1 Tax=Melia azedarach TaxID=155640 RepID=A0ACC1WZ09_MELAZ|nr:Retrovirus-related Pol polyprotein from transposon TNT 1-94 [Melia azedarach]